MNSRSISLNKRIKSDRIISLIVCILIALVGIYQVVLFCTGGDTNSLRIAVHAFTCSAVLALIYLALLSVKKEGKPFTDKVIGYLRTCSVIIITGGILPFFLEMAVYIMRGETYTWNVGDFDLLIPILGVVVGMISEIFVYGKDLQEDNDLIA